MPANRRHTRPCVQVELPVRGGEVAVLEEEELDLPEAGGVDSEGVGLVQFWPSVRLTLNVDQIVRLTPTVSLNPRRRVHVRDGTGHRPFSLYEVIRRPEHLLEESASASAPSYKV